MTEWNGILEPNSFRTIWHPTIGHGTRESDLARPDSSNEKFAVPWFNPRFFGHNFKHVGEGPSDQQNVKLGIAPGEPAKDWVGFVKAE